MDDRYNLLDKFLKNGMDISRFKFRCDDDKAQLFDMYKEYFMGLNAGRLDFDISSDVDNNLIILLNDAEFCTFEITSDYQTIMCHTLHELENPDLMFVLTTFFLTLKELNSMIEQLADMFNVKFGSRPSKSQSNVDNGSGKYKALPDNVLKSMNRIKSIQKTILSDSKKYDTGTDDKEKK
jgi:hypothetical protein